MAEPKDTQYHVTKLTVKVVRMKPGHKPETDTIEVTRRSTRPQGAVKAEDLISRVFGDRSMAALTTQRKDPPKK